MEVFDRNVVGSLVGSRGLSGKRRREAGGVGGGVLGHVGGMSRCGGGGIGVGGS